MDDRESAVRPSAPLGQEPWLDWSPTSVDGLAYQLGRLFNACKFAIERMVLAYASEDFERGDALRKTAQGVLDQLITCSRQIRELKYATQVTFNELRDKLRHQFIGQEFLDGARQLADTAGAWRAYDILYYQALMSVARLQECMKEQVPEPLRSWFELAIAVDSGIRPAVPADLRGPVTVDEQPGSEPAASDWARTVGFRGQLLDIPSAKLRSLKMDSPEERRTTVEDLDRMLRQRLDEHASTEPSTTGSGRIQFDRESGNVIVDGTVYHLGGSDAFELLEGLAQQPGNWVNAKKEIPYFSNIDYRPSRLIPQIREVLGNVIEIESDRGKGVRLIFLTPEPVAH